MKGKNMAIVSYWENEIPPISKEDEAHYKALAEAPDSEINFSDIPKITDFSGFMAAEEARAYRNSRKKQTASL